MNDRKIDVETKETGNSIILNEVMTHQENGEIFTFIEFIHQFLFHTKFCLV